MSRTFISESKLDHEIWVKAISHACHSNGKLKYPGHILNIQKSLYCLRQAGQIWGNLIYIKFIKWVFSSILKTKDYVCTNMIWFFNLTLSFDGMAFPLNNQDLVHWCNYCSMQIFKVKISGQFCSFFSCKFTRWLLMTFISVNQNVLNRFLKKKI